MPIPVIAPIWLTIVGIGLAMLLLQRLRYASAYLILGPTLGLVAAMVFSAEKVSIIRRIIQAVGTDKIYHHAHAINIGTLAGIEISGAIGVLVGTLLAHKINQRLGW